jgi:hypothetical protein
MSNADDFPMSQSSYFDRLNAFQAHAVHAIDVQESVSHLNQLVSSGDDG